MKLFTLTVLTFSTAISGMAMAQGDKVCDGETFSMVVAEVQNAPDDRKEAAIAELKIAKEKVDVGDLDACIVHLENASKAATVE